MWPINGDCPVCAIYGPSAWDLVFEAATLAAYKLMGDPKDSGCDGEDEGIGCVGDGEYTQWTPPPGEPVTPEGISPDEDDSGARFDVAARRRANVFHQIGSLAKYMAPSFITGKKKPALSSRRRRYTTPSPPKAPTKKKTPVKKTKGAYGYGTGDGDGEENNNRQLGEAQHRTAVIGLKGRRAAASSTVQREPQDGAGSSRHHRSAPGWHVKNAAWIVRNAVKGQRPAERHEAVPTLYLEQLADVARADERKQKFRLMTPDQRQKVREEKKKEMTAAQRHNQRKNEEQLQKIDTHFRKDGIVQRYTKVHIALNAHPFARFHGPLPGGWHVGKTTGDLTYYWNDSGAKQMHLPSAPFIARTTESLYSIKDRESAKDLMRRATTILNRTYHMNMVYDEHKLADTEHTNR